MEVPALGDDVYRTADYFMLYSAVLQLSVNIYIPGDTSLFISSLQTDPHIFLRHWESEENIYEASGRGDNPGPSSGQERENIKATDISEKEGQQTDNTLLYYTQSCIVLLYTLAPDIDTNNGIML